MAVQSASSAASHAESQYVQIVSSDECGETVRAARLLGGPSRRVTVPGDADTVSTEVVFVLDEDTAHQECLKAMAANARDQRTAVPSFQKDHVFDLLTAQVHARGMGIKKDGVTEGKGAEEVGDIPVPNRRFLLTQRTPGRRSGRKWMSSGSSVY